MISKRTPPAICAVSKTTSPHSANLNSGESVQRRKVFAVPSTNVTGRSTVDKIDAAIEQGASDYLLKPLDKDELILVLEHAIARCERWQRVALKTDQVAAV